MINVYLAGKIGKNDWRHQVFPDLRGALIIDGGSDDPLEQGGLAYCGPFFVACDHGCYHGKGKHGLGIDPECGSCPTVAETVFSRARVLGMCRAWIKRADALFVWLDDRTAYGTLAEIGFAHAFGIPIWVYGDHPRWRETLADLWLPIEMATGTGWAETAEDAFGNFTIRCEKSLRIKVLKRMPYPEYLQTDHWKTKRAEALRASGNRCQLCNVIENLSVHHRDYTRRGEEEMGDLTVLCRSCHATFHGKNRDHRKKSDGNGEAPWTT